MNDLAAWNELWEVYYDQGYLVGVTPAPSFSNHFYLPVILREVEG